jgi:hypothetical protein
VTLIERAQVARAEANRARRSACRHRERATLLRETFRRDHRLAILTVWNTRRLRYDRLGPVLAIWSGPSLRSELIGDLIGRLFSVGLTLGACRSLAIAPPGDQLIDTTDRLDLLIRDLRAFAFWDVAHPATERVGEVSVISGSKEIVDRLAALADELDVLGQECAFRSPLSPRLDDAAVSVRSAGVLVRDGLSDSESFG